MRISKPMQGIIDRLNWFGIGAAAAGLLVMAGLVVYETLVRYLFKSPVSWAIELPEYTLTWCSAFALSYTQRVKGHIHLDFIESQISSKGRNILNLFIYPIYFGVVAFVSWGLFQLAWHSLVEWQTSIVIKFPLFIPQFILVIGFVSLCFQVIMDLVQTIDGVRGRTEKTTPIEKEKA